MTATVVIIFGQFFFLHKLEYIQSCSCTLEKYLFILLFSAHGEDKGKVRPVGVVNKPIPTRKMTGPQPYKSKMGPQVQKPLNRIRAQSKGAKRL